jgi:hypothetical protein
VILVTQAAALRNADALAVRYRNASPEVSGAIQTASTRTGVDFAYLMEKASAESGFRPDAKAGTSSATGLFQFVEGTWFDMIKSYGAKYGLKEEAAAVSTRIDGTDFVRDPVERKRILELRKDPRISSLLAAEYARENREYLKETVGGTIGSTDLYMAHFLGPRGAGQFLKELRARPNTTAAEIFPEAAKANKGVFYRDGQPQTLQQVYDRFASRFQGAMVTAGVTQPDGATLMQRQVDRLQATGGNTIAPEATPYFTVMMLAQLASPMDGAKKGSPAALRDGKPGTNDADPTARLMVPTLGL